MYEAKNFERLLGTEGFSDAILRNHFTLYEGYVSNTNKLLESLDSKEIGTLEYSELQRRLGWEWNGMRLHELYFGNMVKSGSTFDSKSTFAKKIEGIYGGFEKWKENFTGVGRMRGIGWVVLYYDKEKNELFNAWVNEHDGGHFAGATPLLVMDVFEHAFVLDYGLKRADYISAFWNAIDWNVVSYRFVGK